MKRQLVVSRPPGGLNLGKRKEKEDAAEQFKKQQKLHPEWAGVYAEEFLEKKAEQNVERVRRGAEE